MKRLTYFICFFFLGFVNHLYSQGTLGSDVIIILDNSHSVEPQEYAEMSNSTTELIRKILECNPHNRVSTIHYGTDNYAGTIGNKQPRIWIEYDFTNNLATALNFQRRMGWGDHLHEAVGLIGSAIDHFPNVNIISPINQLNRSSSNSLVVLVFTDADRSAGTLDMGSYLVNFYDAALSTASQPNDNAFLNFTSFKNNRNAKFAVIHVGSNQYTMAAAAAIASLGGNYYGAVEYYPADPDHSMTPRIYLNKNNFTLTNAEINSLSNDICEISNNVGINFSYEPVECYSFVHDLQGVFSLPTGATLDNISLELYNTATAATYPVNSFANINYATNEFYFAINPSNFTVPTPYSGYYKFRVNMNYTLGGTSYTISDINAYTYFNYDVNFNCCVDDLYITLPVVAPNNDIQQASQNIYASNEIKNGAHADYHAGSSVNLMDGFFADYGSEFYGHIENCNYQNLQSTNNDNPNYTIDLSANPNNVQFGKTNTGKDNVVVNIAPNPTSELLHIKSNDKIKSVSVYDILGKKLEVTIVDNVADVRRLPNGNYIITVETANGTSSHKFIKK